MGYKLRREVRDALPPGLLTAAERLLVLELADQCNDVTRECYPGMNALAALTDLSARSIQELTNRVAKKWIDLRVPLGKDDKGKPYYSHAGRRITYRFPPLAAPEGATDPGPYGATDPGASGVEGATDPSGRCDGSVPKVRQIRGPSPHSSSENTSSLSDDEPAPTAEGGPNRERDDQPPATEDQQIRAILAAHHCTGRDADSVIDYWNQRPGGVKGIGWWRQVNKAGDVPARIADALNDPGSQPTAQPDQKPWCGRCYGDKRRFILARLPSGIEKSIRCPDCHLAADPLPAGTTILSNAT